MAKRNWTPDEQARWQAERLAAVEARQKLAASIERLEAKIADQRARRERRQRLIARVIPHRRLAS